MTRHLVHDLLTEPFDLRDSLTRDRDAVPLDLRVQIADLIHQPAHGGERGQEIDRVIEARHGGDQGDVPLRMELTRAASVAPPGIVDVPPEPHERFLQQIDHRHRAVGPTATDVLERDRRHRPEEVEIALKPGSSLLVIEWAKPAYRDIGPCEKEPGVAQSLGGRRWMHGQVEPNRTLE